MKLTTTLAAIKSKSPCKNRYRKLIKYLGGVKKYGKDTPINILTILDSNGFDDALWCLRAVENHEKEIRKIACDFALQVAHLWDMPPIVREYLETQDESIREEASDAASAIGAAAWVAAGAAVSGAARAAASAAAWGTTKEEQENYLWNVLSGD